MERCRVEVTHNLILEKNIKQWLQVALGMVDM